MAHAERSLFAGEFPRPTQIKKGTHAKVPVRRGLQAHNEIWQNAARTVAKIRLLAAFVIPLSPVPAHPETYCRGTLRLVHAGRSTPARVRAYSAPVAGLKSMPATCSPAASGVNPRVETIRSGVSASNAISVSDSVTANSRPVPVGASTS